uniref:Uncharacterized protein n=1 Tax=Physcomitrium patens TaxID=3218 RepID=A0A2K1KU12_PHYPA|nr:hypothetical protein PHYPA_004252 [Physcomitrium patens]
MCLLFTGKRSQAMMSILKKEK